ncbi:hypothetical protein AVEN_99212-1 [Araneus ventricosus]|uniref:Uncharacterized protein n=1 Tax=Araneus ventricosus TaxID=182803 RepID=A0A4Y2CI35_ARAVE|nr:hypothetical protein AVEN_99212-1 [Araneus ventricosus]
MVSASALELVGREFYPGLCSYSVFAIVCNVSLLQVRTMVTSKLALTCCKLVSHLHSCRAKLAASLQICSASLMQTKIAIWDISIRQLSETENKLRISRELKLISHTFGSFDIVLITLTRMKIQ